MLQRIVPRLISKSGSRSAFSRTAANNLKVIFASRSRSRIVQNSNTAGFTGAICFSKRYYSDQSKLDEDEPGDNAQEDADFKRRVERSNQRFKAQSHQSIQERIEEGPPPDPKVKAFTLRLKSIGAEKGLKEAIAFWKRRDPALKLNSISYNVMLTIYARNNACRAAEALWQEMLQAGIKPNIIVCNTMLSAYKTVNNHNGAIKFFSDIISVYHLKPGVDTYNVLIDLCASKGDIAEAIKFWKLMKVEGIPLNKLTIHSLGKVIFSEYAKLYDTEALVRTLFAEIVENDLQPNETFWNFLISARLKQDDVNKALEVLETGKKFGVKLGATSYVLILNYYCEKFQVDKAVELLEQRKQQKELLLPMYNNIIQMFLKLDDLSNAKKYSAEMAEMGFKPNVFFFTIMIQYFAEKDDLDAITDMFQEMQNKGIEPDPALFDVWLQVPFKRKDIKGMEQILSLVDERGFVPRVDFYNRFMIVYSHFRDQRNCERIYDRILDLKLVPSSNTFGSLGGLYALTGKFDKLAVLLEDVKRAKAHFNQTNTVRIMVSLLKKKQAAMAVDLMTIMLNGEQVAPLEAVLSTIDLALAQSPRLLVQLYQNVRQMYRGDLAALREAYMRPIDYLNEHSVLYGDQLTAWKNNFKEMAKVQQLFADREEELKYFRFVFMVAENLLVNISRSTPADALSNTAPVAHEEYLANRDQFIPHSAVKTRQ